MQLEMFEKGFKRPEKIYKKASNSLSTRVLPFYILPVLKLVRDGYLEPVTVQQIQQLLKHQYGYFFYAQQIRLCLNNLHLYSPEYSLKFKEVHAGNTKCKAYSIIPKQQTNKQA